MDRRLESACSSYILVEVVLKDIAEAFLNFWNCGINMFFISSSSAVFEAHENFCGRVAENMGWLNCLHIL